MVLQNQEFPQKTRDYYNYTYSFQFHNSIIWKIDKGHTNYRLRYEIPNFFNKFILIVATVLRSIGFITDDWNIL